MMNYFYFIILWAHFLQITLVQLNVVANYGQSQLQCVKGSTKKLPQKWDIQNCSTGQTCVTYFCSHDFVDEPLEITMGCMRMHFCHVEARIKCIYDGGASLVKCDECNGQQLCNARQETKLARYSPQFAAFFRDKLQYVVAQQQQLQHRQGMQAANLMQYQRLHPRKNSEAAFFPHAANSVQQLQPHSAGGSMLMRQPTAGVSSQQALLQLRQQHKPRVAEGWQHLAFGSNDFLHSVNGSNRMSQRLKCFMGTDGHQHSVTCNHGELCTNSLCDTVDGELTEVKYCGVPKFCATKNDLCKRFNRGIPLNCTQCDTNFCNWKSAFTMALANHTFLDGFAAKINTSQAGNGTNLVPLEAKNSNKKNDTMPMKMEEDAQKKEEEQAKVKEEIRKKMDEIKKNEKKMKEVIMKKMEELMKKDEDGIKKKKAEKESKANEETDKNEQKKEEEKEEEKKNETKEMADGKKEKELLKEDETEKMDDKTEKKIGEEENNEETEEKKEHKIENKMKMNKQQNRVDTKNSSLLEVILKKEEKEEEKKENPKKKKENFGQEDEEKKPKEGIKKEQKEKQQKEANRGVENKMTSSTGSQCILGYGNRMRSVKCPAYSKCGMLACDTDAIVETLRICAPHSATESFYERICEDFNENAKLAGYKTCDGDLCNAEGIKETMPEGGKGAIKCMIGINNDLKNHTCSVGCATITCRAGVTNAKTGEIVEVKTCGYSDVCDVAQNVMCKSFKDGQLVACKHCLGNYCNGKSPDNKTEKANAQAAEALVCLVGVGEKWTNRSCTSVAVDNANLRKCATFRCALAGEKELMIKACAPADLNNEYWKEGGMASRECAKFNGTLITADNSIIMCNESLCNNRAMPISISKTFLLPLQLLIPYFTVFGVLVMPGFHH